jgi:Asparaginase
VAWPASRAGASRGAGDTVWWPTAPPRDSVARVPALIVHAGAGADPAEEPDELRAGVTAAALAGWRVLAADGRALEAVEAAVRALERAGVPRSVAMQMVGHKTEAIYRRYAIVNDADLRAAALKLAAGADAPKAALGTIAGTIGHSGAKESERHQTQPVDLVAEGEGFEPPRASRPGGFQVHCLAS